MNNKNNDSIDFTSIIKGYIKHWKLFIATIFVCGVIGFIYIWIVPPSYKIIANVLVKQQSSDGGNGNMQNILMRSFGGGGSGNVDDEIYVITSHTNLTNTVKLLGLNRVHYIKKNPIKKIDAYDNYPVDVYAPESMIDTLSVPAIFKVNVTKEGEITVNTKIAKYKEKKKADKFPVAIETPYGLFTLTTTENYVPGEKLKTEILVAGYGMVAEDWASMLESYVPNKRTNLISLSVTDANIQRGKDFLNTLIDLYNLQGLENKNIEATKTGEFIDERLSIISKELYDIETEIEKYKVDNKILDVIEDARAAYSKREHYSDIQLQAEMRNHIVAIVEEFINNPENKNSLLISTSGVVGDSEIAKYNNLLIARRELLRSAKPDNPVIKKLDDQIDLAWQNIKDFIAASKEEKEVSLNDVRQLEAEMQTKVSEAPAREKEYLNMKRQQAIKSELFMFLLQRREDNLITLAANTPKGQIVDPAYNLNKPVSLPKKIILLVWLCLGFAIAAGYLYIKDLFKTKFSTREELEKLTALPLLGEVSVNDTGRNIVVSSGDNTSISELFRLIRSNLQFILSNGEKVMLVTSSISGEGKSFISCNLAASLALTGKRVVVVGLDIRQPKLGEYLNIGGRAGVTNYLASNSVSINDIIHKEPFAAGLDIILAGPVPPNPAELLLSDRLEELFKELKKKYDYVIIDSAPVGMVSDTFSIDRISDICIYVCRADYTEKDNIRYAEKLSGDKKLKKLYLVLNATNTKKGYGYGYGDNKK